MSAKGGFSTKDIALIPLFTALIAVCAWITVPLPQVPFTMQTFAVFTTLYVLGGKRGTVSVLLYIVLGAVGLPVFSGFKGGVGALLGTTGGYIAGFLVGALAYWLVTALVKEEKPALNVIALIAALAVCYAFGTAWFMAVYIRGTGAVGLGSVLMMCVVPYILPDLLKMALAVFISRIIKKHI